MTDELTKALKEWRDARQAIFDTQMTLQAGPDLFARLGQAEQALMAIARKMP